MTSNEMIQGFEFMLNGIEDDEIENIEMLEGAILAIKKLEAIKQIVKHYKNNVRDKVTNENMEKILGVLDDTD